jgi:hypothetical protein
MAEWTKATVLKTVVLRTPVNEWLDPMKEAPSFEGASFVSETPPIGEVSGVGYLEGMGMLIGPVGGPNFGPPVSSSETPNSAWNFGL